jgi:hypothetical protein
MALTSNLGRMCHSEISIEEHLGRKCVLQLVRWLCNGILRNRHGHLQHHLPQHLHRAVKPDGMLNQLFDTLGQKANLCPAHSIW